MDEASGRGNRVYRSPIAYEPVRINAAAIYCSDGRIGDHMDEFLHECLALPRYDRVACPGGPVALAGRLLAFWEARGVLDQLRFLVQVHDVRQVVLIAHEGCAFYGEQLRLAPDVVESEQRDDLASAAAAVQRIDPTLEVAGFFAHVRGAEVSYERVFAMGAIEERLRQLPPLPPLAEPAGGPATSREPPSAESPLEILLPGATGPIRLGPASNASAVRGRASGDPTRTGKPAPKGGADPRWVRPGTSTPRR